MNFHENFVKYDMTELAAFAKYAKKKKQDTKTDTKNQI